MYDSGVYPTAEKLVTEMENIIDFEGSSRSMYRILKDIGFKYKKCNDGRKFLMERSDIVAARVEDFLKEVARDGILEPIIVNLQESDSDSDSSETSD